MAVVEGAVGDLVLETLGEELKQEANRIHTPPAAVGIAHWRLSPILPKDLFQPACRHAH